MKNRTKMIIIIVTISSIMTGLLAGAAISGMGWYRFGTGKLFLPAIVEEDTCPPVELAFKTEAVHLAGGAFESQLTKSVLSITSTEPIVLEKDASGWLQNNLVEDTLVDEVLITEHPEINTRVSVLYRNVDGLVYAGDIKTDIVPEFGKVGECSLWSNNWVAAW